MISRRQELIGHGCTTPIAISIVLLGEWICTLIFETVVKSALYVQILSLSCSKGSTNQATVWGEKLIGWLQATIVVERADTNHLASLHWSVLSLAVLGWPVLGWSVLRL